MKEMPNYFSILTAEVRYDKNLKDKAKLLYSEITALSDKYGYCYASNKYFAELYNVTPTTISLLIKDLVDNGYIESEIIYKEGSKEILNRYLKIVKGGYLKNLKEGYLRKVKDNNTSNNNTSINNKYYQNKELNDIFMEYLQMRKKLKAVNSERAIKMLLNKLSNYSDDIKYKMIEQSIVHSWKDVYEIKDRTPGWLDKEITSDEMTPEEVAKFKEKLKL